MFLLTAPIVENNHSLAGIYFYLSKKTLDQTRKFFSISVYQYFRFQY